MINKDYFHDFPWDFSDVESNILIILVKSKFPFLPIVRSSFLTSVRFKMNNYLGYLESSSDNFNSSSILDRVAFLQIILTSSSNRSPSTFGVSVKGITNNTNKTAYLIVSSFINQWIIFLCYFIAILYSFKLLTYSKM